MRYSFIFLISLVLITEISCQSTDEKYYMKEIHKNCKNPDIIEIERKSGYMEIEYMCNGKLYELVIDKKSDAIFTETEADISGIYATIMKKITRNYPDWTIDEYSQVSINDTTLYKFELVKDGIEQNVYFTNTGKLYKAKSFLASDKWNSDILKNNKMYETSPYNFFEPFRTIELPDVLKEISGISIKDENRIFCVQDEIGSVFLYNTDKESIDEIFRFAEIGDFEDIAYHDGSLHILRSDGALFSIKLSDFPKNVNMQYIPMQSMNVEGIAFDAKKGSYLIASNEGNINDTLNRRNIYSFVPKKKTDNVVTEFTIPVDYINSYFKENYSEIKVSTINFSPSAIAIHPITGDYYILSANDRMILIVTPDKKVKAVYALPSDILYKPEGIGFYPNGDMLISNEGTKNGLITPNLLLYKYQ